MNKMMNKIITLIFILFVFVGCKNTKTNAEIKKNNDALLEKYGVIKVLETDSCQYVVWSYAGYAGGIIHKQNCKYCKERNNGK